MRCLAVSLLILVFCPLTICQAQTQNKPAAPKKTAKQPGSPAAREPLPKLFQLPGADFVKKLDKNNDNLLSVEELPKLPPRLFALVDRNTDGKLDVSEVENMLKLIRQRRAGNLPMQPPGEFFLKKVLEQDADNDGKLSKNEVKGKLAENFDRIDTNKNGFLERPELQQAISRLLQLRNRKTPGGAKGSGGGFFRPRQDSLDFDALDSNADGRLTPEEVRNSPLAGRFQALDANRDGRLTRTEFQAMREDQNAPETK